jgi:hypothetical protein
MSSMLLVCRLSSALGLEQPGDASESPALEQEKAANVAVRDAMLRIKTSAEIPVPPTISTPTNTEVGMVKMKTSPSPEEEPENCDAPLTGKPIVLSLPLGTLLSVAYLLIVRNVTGDSQQ